MNTRRLGKTGYQVSEIGFGAWGIGADWGAVDDRESLAALHAAVDAGVTLHRHRRRVRRRALRAPRRSAPGRAVGAASRGDEVRRGACRSTSPSTRTTTSAAGSSGRSRTSASRPSISCSSTASRGRRTTRPSVFDACDRLVDEGVVRAYGVSVEKVEEALKAIEYPGVATRPDHLQHVPAATRRAVLPAGGGARRGRDRARPARLRPADREVRHGTRFARRPPGVQPPRRELRRRRDLLRAWTSRPASRRSRSSVRSCPRRRRWRSSPCAGSSTSTPSRRRSPGRRRPSRRAPTPPRPSLPPLPPATHDTIAVVYRRHIAPQVHQRW